MAGGKFAGGTGTALDPFLIEDAHDFNAMRLYSTGYNFQLIKDINLNTPPYNTGTGWQPIPNFNSKIDGQGHKVSGLRIWSKGDHVGLFLATLPGFRMTNTHFDDVYMELITTDTATKKFTFFGYTAISQNAVNNDFLLGCSLIGKFKIDAPNVIARLVAYDITQNSTSATQTNNVYDCYFELENLGNKQINVFGYNYASIGYPGNARSNYYIYRTIVKAKGDFIGHQIVGQAYFSISDVHLVDELGTSYTNWGTTYPVRTVEYLANSVNLPGFVATSQLGRQVWYFPGTTHVRMADYSRNKFLLEANGEIFSYNVEQGLFSVGVAPVLIDMFVADGMDYIESVPVSVWNQMRTDYGSVDIHCYVEKIPGKSLVTNSEALSFNQTLENKVVMRAVIDFAEHNNDINKIRIPATDQVQPAPTEPVVEPTI